jgi:hypothetical protein
MACEKLKFYKNHKNSLFIKTPFVLTLLFIFTSLVVCTQPNIEWQKCLGGSWDDEAYSIQQVADGGYIVAGTTESNDGDVTGNHAQFTRDYWVIKFDNSGNQQWQKFLGGTDSEDVGAIQQTADGGYIVAGTTFSNDGDVSGNHGSGDFWMVKLDNTGTIQWQKCLGGTEGEIAHDIQQTSDGGYILTGETWSNDGDVSGVHTDMFGFVLKQDYWVVKTDSQGNLQWQKCLGGAQDDRGYTVRETSDGGYIVGGWSNSTDGDVTGNHGTDDYWIVKLSNVGNIQWQKSLGGTNSDLLKNIEQTLDGGFIIAGTSSSSDNDVIGQSGTGDLWVVKIDLNGNIEWQRCLGGTDFDDGAFVQQTADGGYIVTGSPQSNDGDVSGNHSFYYEDFWAVKLNPTGNIVWQKCFGGTNSDESYCIRQTTDGGYIMAGYTLSNNGQISGNHGGKDFWIVKLSAYASELDDLSQTIDKKIIEIVDLTGRKSEIKMNQLLFYRYSDGTVLKKVVVE